MARKPKPTYVEDEPLFNVDVWNQEGDVVKHFRELTAEEVDGVRDQYEDQPWLTVVAEETR
jgi:hypothetical protein